ncbi:MAG: flavin reductase [Christensenellaceae bacterium]|jgi:flavin reductase (DIM6/NTAB) family NADH-FMN oxidoreductase RutF|nr:flavin reductase [Christensenellaceae bacterium]
MKREYAEIPPSMAGMQTYGFSWMDFVSAIPSPLFIVSSYKSNGKPNACLQSWACFNGGEKGFYAILSSVNKKGHLYQTLKERGEAVLNFPSAEIYALCEKTIQNNGFDDDEIALSGLTAEPAALVDAPRIRECFLNLECRYLWEREIVAGTDHALVCLEVVNLCADEAHLNESALGRYGESGYLYNVHYPVDPESFAGRSQDWLAILQKHKSNGEY